MSVGEQREIRERLLRERKYAPVFLDPKRERLFYDGFCKRVLWPLFHCIPTMASVTTTATAGNLAGARATDQRGAARTVLPRRASRRGS